MILSLQGINKSFGSRQVLNSVSMFCVKGEICGLIGPNGAGKSTLFRIITGLIRPDSGSIEISSVAEKPIGSIIDKPALYGYLSAFDNLRVFAGLQRLHLSRELYLERMAQVGLDPERQDPVRNYSTGMKQRLGLAIALINQPECIVLDEPFSGLDPMGSRVLHDLILKLAKDQQIAVLVSSHNIAELAELCETIYVINHGVISEKKRAALLLKDNATFFIIHGRSLETSAELKRLKAEFRDGNALVAPGEMGIETLIEKLVSEGIRLSGCVPQTDLSALFHTRSE